MCRYDDDFDWYVDSEHHERNTVERNCEDCGRKIGLDEDVIRFTAMPNEEDDERPLVLVVPVPPAKYCEPGEPYLALLEEGQDDQVTVERWEALGFTWDEVRDPRLPPPESYPDAYSCVQCRAADYWLREVCSQSTVLVAQQDLLEHEDLYEPAMLGPDFGTLATLARRRWRTKDFGRIIPEHVVERLARDAVAHAVLVGLHP
jgi:hypothetical protein